MKEIATSSRIEKALLKRAVGYSTTEVVKEYSINEAGESVLTKKKVAQKKIPPDISAAKLLLDSFKADEMDLTNMTDDELNREKMKLIALLKDGEKIED